MDIATEQTTERKEILSAFRYLAEQADNLSIYQVEFIGSLKKQWKRQHKLSEKQMAALYGITDSIKDIKNN